MKTLDFWLGSGSGSESGSGSVFAQSVTADADADADPERLGYSFIFGTALAMLRVGGNPLMPREDNPHTAEESCAPFSHPIEVSGK
jgi:hypothetical protein